jgi:hypothetical protein
MGDLEMTILLVAALVGFAWVIVRIGRGLSAPSDRADTLRMNEQSGNRDS